ncbi:hypothetical protein Mapa_000099 [Marchantia paleacea]|nr:hypothetical protein Mapa_000099 [Marchantia paleacea]
MCVELVTTVWWYSSQHVHDQSNSFVRMGTSSWSIVSDLLLGLILRTLLLKSSVLAVGRVGLEATDHSSTSFAYLALQVRVSQRKMVMVQQGSRTATGRPGMPSSSNGSSSY